VDPAEVIEQARAEVAEAAERIARRAPEPAAPAGRVASVADLVVGARVFVAKLGGRGEIVSAPDKGKVTVAIGALKTTVLVDEVRLDDTPVAKARQASAPRKQDAVKRRPASAAQAPNNPDGTPGDPDLAVGRTPDATCDLRGQRVDEGLAELDRFLDASVMAEREIIFVIHGHGTGAMKSAVRQHLGAHAAVDKTRPGTLREGGDGVTVVWLTA
jgi:DNA mismatch repair protein MutS2